jgi:predicted regulator of Ras-like GTPase activity (Roadblock/LC7/MglB family)
MGDRMREVLQELNREVGVTGSMVLTRDGIMVASELGAGLQHDTVAAIASSVVQSFNKILDPLKQAPFFKFVFTTAHGKMVFVATGEAYLVVVLNKDIKIDVSMLSIEGAARRIRNLTEIRL